MAVKTERVRVEFAGEINASLNKAVNSIKKSIAGITANAKILNSQLEKNNKKLAQNANAMQKAAKGSKGYGKEVKHVGDEFQRYNTLLSKFQTDAKQGFKSAEGYFRNFADGVKAGGEGLEFANRATTNYVHGLKGIQENLTRIDKTKKSNNASWRKWGDTVKWVNVEQGRLAGALKVTSQGIKMLNPSAKQYLNLTNDQYQALQKLEGKTQGYVKATDQLWNKTKGVTGVFNEKVKVLDKADRAIAKTAASMDKAGANGQRYYETANRLTVANNMMNKGFINGQGHINAIAKNFGFAEKRAGLLTRALAGVVDSFKSMARYAAGAMVFYQLFNLFRTGAQSIIDFSQGMKDLQAIINETDENIERLGETVKEVAANTKYSTTEVAEGMKLLGQAGLSTSEIMQSIESVAQLATGTMTDFKTTSDLMTTTIRAFQMNFLETGRVADVFANAINRSKLTVEKLRVSFNYLAPLAKAANITFEETSAALMMLANSGIRASTMGTGMRQILIRLVNPTAEFAAAIEAAGYSVRDFNPLHNDLADIFDRLNEVVPTAAEAIRFFHVRSLPAVMVFASQGGSALKKFMKDIEEVGAAIRMMETQTEGLGIKFKQVADRFSVLSVAIGQSGIDFFLHLVADGLRGLLNILTKVVEQGFFSMTLAMGVTVTALKTLQGGVTLLINTKLAKHLFGWTAGIRGFGASLITTTKHVYTTRGAIAALTISLKRLWAVLISNPLIAGAALIVGIGTAIKRWQNRNENLIKSLNKQREIMETVVDQLELYQSKINEAAEGGDPFIHFIERAIQEIPELRGKFTGILNDVKAINEVFEETKRAKNEQIFKDMQQAALAAAKDLHKYRRVLEQTDQVFIDWYKEAGEPGVFKHPMVKAFEEAEAAIEKNEARIREYVGTVIAEYRKKGKNWKEISDEILETWLDQGNVAIKHLGTITEVTDELITLAQKREQEEEKALKKMPTHLEEYANEHKEHYDEIQSMYEEHMSKMVKLGELGEVGDEIMSDHALTYIRELEQSLKDLTGENFNLSASFQRVNFILKDLPEEVKRFRANLPPLEKAEFEKGLYEVIDDIAELEKQLQEFSNLTKEEISFELDKETIKKTTEFIEQQMDKQLEKLDYFHDRYREKFEVVNETESKILTASQSYWDRTNQIQEHSLNRKIQLIDRNAQEQIRIIENSSRLYKNVEEEKYRILREAEAQKLKLVKESNEREKEVIAFQTELHAQHIENKFTREKQALTALLDLYGQDEQKKQEIQKRIVELERQTSEEILQLRTDKIDKILALQDKYLSDLQNNLNEEYEKEKVLQDKIKNLKQKEVDIATEKYDTIRDIHRSRMEEEEKSANSIKEYNRNMNAARKAQDLGWYKQAEELSKRAIGFAKELDNTHKAKISLLEKAFNLRSQMAQEEQKLHQEELNTVQNTINAYEEKISSVEKAIQKLSEQKLVIDVELAKKNLGDVGEKLQELRKEVSEKFASIDLTFNDDSIAKLKTRLSSISEGISDVAETTMSLIVKGEEDKDFSPYIEEVKDKVEKLKAFVEEEDGVYKIFFRGEGSSETGLIAKVDEIIEKFNALKNKFEEEIKVLVDATKAKKELEEVKEAHEAVPKETVSVHTVNVNGLDLLSQAIQMHDKLNGKHTTSSHTVTQRTVQARNEGGEIEEFATGGNVPTSGFRNRDGKIPGRGIKDDVPALLTRGEYVQPVSTVDYYGAGFMEALRQKKIPKETLPHFAIGGRVTTPSQYESIGYNNLFRSFNNSWGNRLSFYRLPTTVEAERIARSAVDRLANSNLPFDEKFGEEIQAKVINTVNNLKSQFAGLGSSSKGKVGALYNEVMGKVSSTMSSATIDTEDTDIQKNFASQKKTIRDQVKIEADFLRDNGHNELATMVLEFGNEVQKYIDEIRDFILDLKVQLASQRAEIENDIRSKAESIYDPLKEKYAQAIRSRNNAYDMRALMSNYVGVLGRASYQKSVAKSSDTMLAQAHRQGTEAGKMILPVSKEKNRAEESWIANVAGSKGKAKREGESTIQQATGSFESAKLGMDKLIIELTRDFRLLEIQSRKDFRDLVNSFVSGKEKGSGVTHWLNEGGRVGMTPTATKGVDSVLAALTPGEYVVREPVVNRLGTDFFDKINKGMLPGFNKGGLVGNDSKENDFGYNATVNLTFGDKTYKTKMEENSAKDFVQQLRTLERRM